MRTLKKLFLDELADRYDSEKRLVLAMPTMIRAATCKHLKKLFQAHLKETETHVKKLEKVFRLFDEKPRTKKCEATIGLLREGEEVAADNTGYPVLNAALISVAQKLEHYEIATYGCLRNWAKLLENRDAADLLQEILVEEKATNHALSELARSRSNPEALGEGKDTESCRDRNGQKSPKHARRGARPVGAGTSRQTASKA